MCLSHTRQTRVGDVCNGRLSRSVWNVAEDVHRSARIHNHLKILTLNLDLTVWDTTAGALCDIHMLAL